jgi:hypothetical protein
MNPFPDRIALAMSSASALEKYRYTVCRVTPSRRATSAMRIAGPRSATTSSAASRILAIASSSKAGLTPLHPWLRTGGDDGVDVELDG